MSENIMLNLQWHSYCPLYPGGQWLNCRGFPDIGQEPWKENKIGLPALVTIDFSYVLWFGCTKAWTWTHLSFPPFLSTYFHTESCPYLASWKRRVVLGWYISRAATSSKAEGAIIVIRDTTTLTCGKEMCSAWWWSSVESWADWSTAEAHALVIAFLGGDVLKSYYWH